MSMIMGVLMSDTEKFDFDEAVKQEIVDSPDISPDELNRMTESGEALETEIEAVNEPQVEVYLEASEEERETTELLRKALKGEGDELDKDKVLDELILNIWAKLKNKGKGTWFYVFALTLITGIFYREPITNAVKAVWGFINKGKEVV